MDDDVDLVLSGNLVGDVEMKPGFGGEDDSEGLPEVEGDGGFAANLIGHLLRFGDCTRDGEVLVLVTLLMMVVCSFQQFESEAEHKASTPPTPPKH